LRRYLEQKKRGPGSGVKHLNSTPEALSSNTGITRKKKKKVFIKLGVMARPVIPALITWEAGIKRIGVQGQLGLHIETLSEQTFLCV
jgi:hypothetical protein